MSMIRLLLTAALVAVVLLGSSWLQATVIVMIQTNDGYWIGADGVRSFQGSKPEAVCKIHQVHGWLLVKSGESQSWDRYGRDYSVDAEVKKPTGESLSVAQLKNDLKGKFLEDETEVIRTGGPGLKFGCPIFAQSHRAKVGIRAKLEPSWLQLRASG